MTVNICEDWRRAWLVPNLELTVFLGRGLFDHHLCHLRRWRAMMQLFDELPDGRFVTLQ